MYVPQCHTVCLSVSVIERSLSSQEGTGLPLSFRFSCRQSFLKSKTETRYPCCVESHRVNEFVIFRPIPAIEVSNHPWPSQGKQAAPHSAELAVELVDREHTFSALQARKPPCGGIGPWLKPIAALLVGINIGITLHPESKTF